MCALGELPPIDLAIHADTGHEASGTYEHARLWTPWLGERGVKVVTVTPSDSKAIRMDWGKDGSVMIPAYSLRRRDGGKGQLQRQCTSDWKIAPIRRHIRSLLGTQRPQSGTVEAWQGISLDEYQRMRTSDVQYIVNTYPLVDRRMTRAACIQWLQEHELPVPPKSACVFCPFHSSRQWQKLKREGGGDWEYAVAVDEAVRERRGRTLDLYIHNARLPLEQAVTIPEDEGAHQLELEMPCDGGVCFV